MKKRPLGVTVLAGVAGLASACLLVYSVVVLSEVIRGRFVGITGNIVLVVVAISLLALTWISGVAALDLWKLRKRGRSLTIISMAFLCLLGGTFASVSPRHGIDFYSGCGTCALTLSAIVYLYLPDVRRKFESDSIQTVP